MQTPRTRGPRSSASGTVGTSPVTILAAGTAIEYLRIHNPSKTAQLCVTYDGVTVPVVNSVGITISALGADEQTLQIPGGGVSLIADGASSPYYIEWV